jgi:hypothetical protein
MAISYSGEGYKFNPQFANLGSLQGLQPLDVTRKAEFQLQPLAYAPIQSSRPELVSEGISKGLLAAVGGITEGITAKYKAEQKKEEKLAERSHELKLADLKTKQYDPYIEALKTRKLELETSAIDKRIEGSVPAGAKRRIFRSIDTEPLPESTETTDDKIDFNLTPSGLETTSIQGGDMSANIADQAKALENISAKYLTASTDSGIGPFAPIEQPKSMQLAKVSTSLISPEQEKEIQSKFEPYGIPSVLEKTPQKTLLSIEKAQPKEEVKIKPPRAIDVDTEEEAQAEAFRDIPGFKKGKYTVEVDEYGQPFFRVPPREPITQKELDETEASKQRLSVTKQNTLNREQVNFQTHPDIKAFLAPNGMRQSIGKFVRDYDAIAKNPEASGISDIGLLDMFARAEGGGRVTEGQAHLVLSSMGLLDKAKVLGMRLEGGDKLSQNQRDQMLRVISEDHVSQANLANQQVQMKRNQLKKQGITDEDDLPQFFILPQTKWEAEGEISQMKSEAIALNNEKKQLFSEGKKEEASKIDKELKSIGEKAIQLRKKIDKSKSAIINLHEMETTPQGWSGGAAAILVQ